MNISERLRKIADYKNLSYRAFALKIGTSSQVFGTYLRGRVPSFEVISSIIETYDDISAEWLLTGNGNMLKSSSTPHDSPETSSLILSQQRTIENLSETIKNLTSK